MTVSRPAVLVVSERLYARHLRWPYFLTSVLTAATTNLQLSSGSLGWQISPGALREREFAFEHPVLTQEFGRADWQLEGCIHGALAALIWLAEREEARQAAVRG
ncbi:hypothetical protein [Deinococcus humi]|uniref:Uncharacterized protein n=1 Tax=Deinococcus humi TaxID=662880 RepID=A0A7W8JVH0_9DEIO|nr:hypothetical protein [Deinococcus humi]MBB5363685.1 hypothetical protein [Deinococcus humi]GGO29768.1 hypothetical protein GCM10008949_23720 [Deinococcus humi]